jgi:hypothetical protein
LQIKNGGKAISAVLQYWLQKTVGLLFVLILMSIMMIGGLLGGVFAVFYGVSCVAMCLMGVVVGLFVLAFFVQPRRMFIMLSCTTMMFRCCLVMFNCWMLFSHNSFTSLKIYATNMPISFTQA